MIKTIQLISFTTVLITVLFSSCNPNNQPTIKMPPAIALANMDTLVKPQQDFFQFVNGKWLENNQIPPDRSRWGSFDELRKKNDSVTLAVLEEAIEKGVEEGTDQRKAADYFAAVLDTITRNKQGIEPIKEILAEVDAVQEFKHIEKLNAKWAPYGGALFGLHVYADMKNSNMNTAYFGGPALGMGRDYYQKEDAESKEKLQKYQAYMSQMLQNINVEQANKVAADIVALEKRIAKASLTIVERRDARNRYNKFAVADLNQLIPDYDFNEYFKTVGLAVDTIIVSEKNFFKEIGKIAKDTPIETIKNYLKWSVLNTTAQTLSTKLEKQKFDFYNKTLQGIEEQRPIKERALNATNAVLGEAVGKLYVDKTFPPAAKDSAKIMIDYLTKAFEKHIKNLAWMSDSTKIKALDKLSKFAVKIGYPDKWEDYSAMEIQSPEKGGTYFSNTMAAQVWEFKDNIKDYQKPVDKTKWGMPPQTVNAYFNPLFNEIVFPAAILQPPFFNFEADAAVNFGGIGAVIGHEISHGFDDSGARYDGDGNLNNWFTKEDLAKFEQAGKALANQYNEYQPVPNTFVNGEFTLGENIGDLGGVNVAYTALQNYLADKGTPNKIDGFTPNQRFFISWATIWRTKMKEEAAKNQVKTDPHSPGQFRAVGPLVNIDAFHEAFATKQGDAMYKPKEDRITIW